MTVWRERVGRVFEWGWEWWDRELGGFFSGDRVCGGSVSDKREWRG